LTWARNESHDETRVKSDHIGFKTYELTIALAILIVIYT